MATSQNESLDAFTSSCVDRLANPSTRLEAINDLSSKLQGQSDVTSIWTYSSLCLVFSGLKPCLSESASEIVLAALAFLNQVIQIQSQAAIERKQQRRRKT